MLIKNFHPMPLRLILLTTLLWPVGVYPAEPEVQSIAFGKAALAFSAGFIRKEIPLDGSVPMISGAQSTGDNRRLLGTGDRLYLKMLRPDEAAPGDTYTIYRRVHEVFHPRHGTYLGNLVTIIGLVSVLDVVQDLASVRVVRAYDSIVPGDYAMQFVPPTEEDSSESERALPDAPGVIVDLPPQRTLIAQYNVVYIDWGREEGLRIGDRLEVFREAAGLPKRTIGELKVIALEDHTGTAQIVRSTASFFRGDRFIYKESPPPQPGETAGAGQAEPQPAAKPAPAPPTSPLVSPTAIGLAVEGERMLADLARQIDFQPGEATLGPEDQTVLKQISGILRNVHDKQIRIEGHADNMDIGPTLKPQFPTNTELSRARAVNVARYLVEQGVVDPTLITAVGHADTKPVANNETEEGRKKNRRIEIVLTPREPSEPPKTGGGTLSRTSSDEAFKSSPLSESPAPPKTEPEPAPAQPDSGQAPQPMPPGQPQPPTAPPY